MNNRCDIKLIVTDMDETLLRRDKSVSPYTKSVIDEIRKKGILFSICTGRIQPMTVAYAKMLELQSPYITANGALIWDPVAEKTLWGKPLDTEDVKSMAVFCEENDIDYGVLTMETSYFSGKGATKARFGFYNSLAKQQGLPAMDLKHVDKNLSCLEGVTAYKFLIWNETLEKIPIAEKFLNTIPGAEYTSSSKGLIDITYRGINKGTGVARLAEILGIDKESVCAFGDYQNDISMFREAGYTVAMENGSEEIKKAAGYITKSNEEDGVAYAIRHIFWL